MSGANAERLRDPMGLYRLGYVSPLLETPSVRWDGPSQTEQTETVVEETPVAIVYNGIPHVVMMATPADLEDFALGFSLTEELIQSPEDLEQLQVVRYSRGVEIQAIVAERCAEVIARADPAADRADRLRHLRRGWGGCGAQDNPSGPAREPIDGRRGSAGARCPGRPASRSMPRAARCTRPDGPEPTARSS